MSFASVTYTGGVQAQCRMWYEGLKALGHEVYLINNWDSYEYEKFDYFIIVGCGRQLIEWVRLFKMFVTPKIIVAPIIDPNTMSVLRFKMECRYLGSTRRGLSRPYHDFYTLRDAFKFILVRSEFEKEYILKGLGVKESKVRMVPISMRFKEPPTFNLENKDRICLHVSRLASPEKNVARLISAAKKYNIRLRLAGMIHGETERTWLLKQIEGCANIEYIGRLSDEELICEYRKAKVFALPSINEGVGMVALEAAAYGCEICLTEEGGPKEYFDGQAVLVNPYNVDSIGQGILEAMNSKHAQPRLSNFIVENYSVINCMKILERCLKE